MNPILPGAALWFADHPFALGLAKGALLLVLAALLSAALAKSRLSAAARHAVLACGLVCALLVPCLSFAPAALSFRWQVPALAEAETAAPSPAAFEAAAPPNPSAASAALPAPAHRAQAGWAAVLGRVPAALWLAIVWALGALAVAGIILVGHLRLRLSARRMKPVQDARLLCFFAAECARQKVRASLWMAGDATLAPAAFGAFASARVVLPAAAEAWSDADLCAVLAHELAHVARHDWPMKLLAQALVTLYWFHPCAWWLARRMEEEAECACDDRVVAGGAALCDYADCMFHLAQTISASPSPAWTRASEPFHSFLPKRIAMLLEPSRNRRPLCLSSVCLGAALLAPAVLFFGAVSCTAPAQKPEAAVCPREFAGALLRPVLRADGHEAVTFTNLPDSDGDGTHRVAYLCKDGKAVCSFPYTVADSFSPDGRYLLLQEVSEDDDVQWFLWDVRQSCVSERIGGRWVEKAAWNQDSKILRFTANKNLGEDSDCTPEKLQWREMKPGAEATDPLVEVRDPGQGETLKYGK